MAANLVVGIPALNEAASIGTVIANIPRDIPGVGETTILVIDDGSSDETAAIAADAGARVVSHHRTLGLGNAFRTMLREAIGMGADVLVTIDADGQFDPGDIPVLVEPVLAGAAQVATASRFADADMTPNMPAIKKWGNRRVARLVSRLTGHEFHDVSCGFRAYSREALLQLTVQGAFTYTHETFLDLSAKDISIKEVPLRVRGEREFGESRMASSILRYAAQTSSIMVRFYRDQQPLKTCILLTVPLVVAGIVLLGVSLRDVLTTGVWLKWAAFLGGALLATSVAVVFLGFMADMASRLRKNQEEIIYWSRRIATDREARRPGDPKTVEDAP